MGLLEEILERMNQVERLMLEMRNDIKNNTGNTPKRLLTTMETCEFLRISKSGLYQLKLSGELEPVQGERGGRCRYDIRDIESYIERTKVGL